MRSLESSLLDYVNDDVPFDFLLGHGRSTL